MVLRIVFRMSWAVSFHTISRTSLGGQTACSLVLITLAGTMRGREVLAPWLAEGATPFKIAHGIYSQQINYTHSKLQVYLKSI